MSWLRGYHRLLVTLRPGETPPGSFWAEQSAITSSMTTPEKTEPRPFFSNLDEVLAHLETVSPGERMRYAAEAARSLARELGAQHVIAMTGLEGPGAHYIAWTGGFGAIGLLEIGALSLRRNLLPEPPPLYLVPGYGGASAAVTPPENRGLGASNGGDKLR